MFSLSYVVAVRKQLVIEMDCAHCEVRAEATEAVEHRAYSTT